MTRSVRSNDRDLRFRQSLNKWTRGARFICRVNRLQDAANLPRRLWKLALDSRIGHGSAPYCRCPSGGFVHAASPVPAITVGCLIVPKGCRLGNKPRHPDTDDGLSGLCGIPAIEVTAPELNATVGPRVLDRPRYTGRRLLTDTLLFRSRSTPGHAAPISIRTRLSCRPLLGSSCQAR